MENKELILEDSENNCKYSIILDETDYSRALNDPLFASSLLKHAREANDNQTIQFEVSENTDTSMDVSASYAPDHSKRTEKRSHEETEIPDRGDVNNTYVASPNEGRSTWTRREILTLIRLFAENQNSFKSSTITKDKFWNGLAKKMGSDKSGDQCRNKFKYLKSMYLKKKDNMSSRQTGSALINFTYFDEMDQIFNKDHNVKPLSIASSMNNSMSEASCSKENIKDKEPSFKRCKQEKDFTVLKTLLVDREAGAERRHRENLEKKEEALNVCKELLALASKIISKKN